MNLATIQMLYDYNYWAWNRVWECVLQLSDNQFTHDLGYSMGSIHGQLVHSMFAEYLWCSRLQGISLTTVFKNEDYPSREAVRHKWTEIEATVRTFLQKLDLSTLEQRFQYKTTAGDPRETKVLPILLHIINHATDHRAQTLAMIHQLGGPTVEQDLIFYLLEHQLG